MFTLAPCDGYVDLKRKYRDAYSPYGFDWSLKEYASLFIYDYIRQHKPDRVLEFGPGFGRFFSDVSKSHGVDYWCIDEHSSGLGIGTDADRYRDVVSARSSNGHGTIDGLLGDGHDALRDDYFDLVFSISVVEHIAAEQMGAVVREADRVLRPGGTLINTIDIYHGSEQHLNWHGQCRSAGFEVPGPHDLTWHLSGARTTFLERQDIRYLIYNGLQHDDGWAANIPYSSQFASAFHIGVGPR